MSNAGRPQLLYLFMIWQLPSGLVVKLQVFGKVELLWERNDYLI